MTHDAETPPADEVEAIESLPKQVGLGPAGRGISAAAAAALASAATLGGAAPLAFGIVAANASTQEIGARLNKIQAEKEEELFRRAAETSALTPQEFILRVLEDDELTLLAAEAIDAARRTRVKEKTRALGTSLGSLVADKAMIDPETVWIRILASVERPHIRLLALFLHGSKLKDGAIFWRPSAAITVREAGERLGLQDAVLPLVQDLVRCGLIMSPGMDDRSPSGSELSADGLNQKMTATWLGPKLFMRLGMEGESHQLPTLS